MHTAVRHPSHIFVRKVRPKTWYMTGLRFGYFFSQNAPISFIYLFISAVCQRVTFAKNRIQALCRIHFFSDLIKTTLCCFSIFMAL